MQIITDYTEPFESDMPIAAAIGYFDGVHLGHQKIIENTKIEGFRRAVITFSNHPLSLLKGEDDVLQVMSLDDRIQFFSDMGIDYLFVYPFDRRMQSMHKEEFVKKILFEKGIQRVVVGFNFTFGINREGNTENIEKLCSAYGIATTVIPPILYKNDVISTTYIKKALYRGDVISAKEMLGKYFHLTGIVNDGKKLGRTINFPTANFDIPKDIIVPKWGVYETRATVLGESFKAVTNIGNKPTIDGDVVNIETHILDFSEMIYGEMLKIEFIRRLRGEIKFPDIEALRKRLEYDVQTVRLGLVRE